MVQGGSEKLNNEALLDVFLNDAL